MLVPNIKTCKTVNLQTYAFINMECGSVGLEQAINVFVLSSRRCPDGSKSTLSGRSCCPDSVKRGTCSRVLSNLHGRPEWPDRIWRWGMMPLLLILVARLGQARQGKARQWSRWRWRRRAEVKKHEDETSTLREETEDGGRTRRREKRREGGEGGTITPIYTHPMIYENGPSAGHTENVFLDRCVNHCPQLYV